MSATAAAPPPKDVVADLEHPTDVLRTINFATQSLTLFFVTLFVYIRCFLKYGSGGLRFAVDDYLVLISWALMVGYCVCGIFLSVYGGGYHIWEVPSTNTKPFFQMSYAATIFYAPMALFVKLSLLTIVARVFSPYRKTVYGIYVLDFLLICYYISQLVVKIRICWPISAYWEGDASRCLDQAAVIMADSIISLISDVVILLLPLPLTWSLQLPRKRKLKVAGMLGMGGLATAFSAWRLHLILIDGKSPDQTIVFVQVVLSGNAEAGIGLICACLPAAAALLHRVRAGTGYGSSRSNPSRSYQLSNFDSRRAGKERTFENFEAASETTDEATLVTYARQQDSPDPDLDYNGIMRRVEVSVVSTAERGTETEKEIHG